MVGDRRRVKDRSAKESPYRLGDVINHNSTVGVSIIHGSERLVPFLASSIPNFELDCGTLIEGDSLGQEGSTDCRLPVIIELVLGNSSASSFLERTKLGIQKPMIALIGSLTFTNLKTSELWRMKTMLAPDTEHREAKVEPFPLRTLLKI